MINPHIPIQVTNLRAIAWHLEQGEENGGISKEALALQLRSIANVLDNSATMLDTIDKMREAQKIYFKTRSKDALLYSKELEGVVDSLILSSKKEPELWNIT